MTRTTPALLLAGIFLSGLEEAILSQRGHCAEDQCFALFLESKDFSSAKTSCKDSTGELFIFSSNQAVARLLNGLSGRLWLTSTDGTTDPQLCSSMSVTMGGNLTLLRTPCRDQLDGFLCQYTVESPCSRLQAVGAAQVRYAAHEGFEVYDSDTFPQGTVAVVEKVGAKYPDSKHVCFMSTWLRAPWRCEVLNGGCEHGCDSASNTCACPAKQALHPNNITCDKKPCADCAKGCKEQDDSYVCTCPKGYRLAQDKKSCLDVDECKKNPCTGEGKTCENTPGGFECKCKDDFLPVNGVCVDASICHKCEHMICNEYHGVFKCQCRPGFRVSPKDPTRCEKNCTKRDCPATCISNPEVKKDMEQCFCPDGYINDVRNNTTFCTDIDECEDKKQCDHKCENFFGGYRCLCNEGYNLKNDKCVRIDGPSSNTSYPTPASTHPVTVPPYIKTGSVLGITVFMVLCMAVLYFLSRNISKRCGRLEISSFKSGDIDIFYLQQVTTDTYKRLSFDKQFKNDLQKPELHH